MWLDRYLVESFICAEISRMLKKNQLEKLVTPLKRSAWLHPSTHQILPGGISLMSTKFVFSSEVYIKTGESIWKGLSFMKSIIKASSKDFKKVYNSLKKLYESFITAL